MRCKLSPGFKRDFKKFSFGILNFIKETALPVLVVAGIFLVLLPSMWFIIGYVVGNIFNFWPETQASSPLLYYISSGIIYFIPFLLSLIILILLFVLLIKVYMICKNFKQIIAYIFDCKENK